MMYIKYFRGNLLMHLFESINIAYMDIHFVLIYKAF